MLSDWLLELLLRSLASYIKKFACSNAKTEDLWAALEEGSNEPVNKLMNSWTRNWCLSSRNIWQVVLMGMDSGLFQ
nr:aminopeptidase m1-a [Quercus suber]